jgi:hypothetical protein
MRFIKGPLFVLCICQSCKNSWKIQAKVNCQGNEERTIPALLSTKYFYKNQVAGFIMKLNI